mgnify:CR=1 FL=1
MDTSVSPVQALERAIKAVGTMEKLGIAVGLPGKNPKQVVWQWKANGRVPIEYCAGVEIASGRAATRQQLRPNDWMRIWPELATPETAAA